MAAGSQSETKPNPERQNKQETINDPNLDKKYDFNNAPEIFNPLMDMIVREYPHSFIKLTGQDGHRVLLLKSYDQDIATWFSKIAIRDEEISTATSGTHQDLDNKSNLRPVFTEQGFGLLKIENFTEKETPQMHMLTIQWNNDIVPKIPNIADTIRRSFIKARRDITGIAILELGEDSYDVTANLVPLSKDQGFVERLGKRLFLLERAYGENDERGDISARELVDSLKPRASTD